MNKDQSLTFELLIILGVVLILISPLGDWLASLVSEISVFHPTTLNFNPINSGSTTMQNAATGGGSTTHQFDIPLTGGGSVHVNASDVNAAKVNAQQETGIAPA